MADEIKPVWKVCQTYYAQSPSVKEMRDKNGQIAYFRPTELQEDRVCAPVEGASSDVFLAEKTLDGIKSREARNIPNFSHWNESGKEYIAIRAGIKGKRAATVADAEKNLVVAEKEDVEKRRIAEIETERKREYSPLHGTRNFQ